MATNVILREEKATQAEVDSAQEMHGKFVQKQLEERDAIEANRETMLLISTKQTTKEHLGKILADENKPDEMEAIKVGKFTTETPVNLAKIEQTATVTKPDGEQSDEVVDVIQVPEVRAQYGLAVPGGDVPLTEPQKVAAAIEEELGPPPEVEHPEGEGAETKSRKKKKS